MGFEPDVISGAISGTRLNRKNALFAGSDGGGANWAVIASLIETYKLECRRCRAHPVGRHPWPLSMSERASGGESARDRERDGQPGLVRPFCRSVLTWRR
jgi:hypothetical protein